MTDKHALRAHTAGFLAPDGMPIRAGRGFDTASIDTGTFQDSAALNGDDMARNLERQTKSANRGGIGSAFGFAPDTVIYMQTMQREAEAIPGCGGGKKHGGGISPARDGGEQDTIMGTAGKRIGDS
jgi:hypothetical protein